MVRFNIKQNYNYQKKNVQSAKMDITEILTRHV